MGIFELPPGSSMDPDSDRRPSLYWVSGVFMFLTLTTVLLRFVSRRLGQIPLKADDWLILGALPFAFVTNGVNIYGARNNGEGRHINHSTSASLNRFFQATYVFLICYNISITLSKFSLIYFYRRIFSTEGFKKPLLATAALATGWLIGCTFATVFSCSPVSGFWEMEAPSKCIDERAFYIGQTASNMFLDVLLMILPMFTISRLHMSRVHKAGVIGIFALGIFVTICSVIRLNALIKIEHEEEFDFTYDIVDSANWSVIENNVSIICACLPTLRPIIRLVLPSSALTRSTSVRNSNGRPLDSRGNAISGPFSPLGSRRDRSLAHPLEWEDGAYQARAYAGTSRHGSQRIGNTGQDSYELDQRIRDGREDIKVNTDITWYESRRPSTTGTGSTDQAPLKVKDIESS